MGTVCGTIPSAAGLEEFRAVGCRIAVLGIAAVVESAMIGANGIVASVRNARMVLASLVKDAEG